MSTLAHRMARQHGVVVALVTALAVLVLLLAQDFLSAVFSSLGNAASNLTSPVSPAYWFGTVGQQLALQYVPFAVGLFLSFWFIAPIGAALRLFHVVTRSLLAATVGAAAVIVVQVTTGLYLAFQGPLGSMTGFSGRDALHNVVWGILTGALDFVRWVPVVVLAGVLLWIWLERHPAKHAVTGMIDEV